jgi:hypothetical protein
VSARIARRGLTGLGLALALGTGLTGCTLPDVGMSPGLTEEAATQAATTPPAESTAAARTSSALVAEEPAAPAVTRPAGDLDTGSITHSVLAGDRTVVVDYWTSEDALHWTADGDKTVQLSAHIEGGSSAQEVEVTRFVATGDDGTTRTTLAEDRGEFVLTPPYSYTSALSVTPSGASATELTVHVQFDLLVETEPGSDQWFRQTVLDSIRLPFLPEDPQ